MLKVSLSSSFNFFLQEHIGDFIVQITKKKKNYYIPILKASCVLFIIKV